MSPGCQRNRTWYSGTCACWNRKRSSRSLSSRSIPVMWVVKEVLTNSMRRPVSGWVRTTGCSTGGKRSWYGISRSGP
ncbi:hypothetical protein SROCM77S_06295 [Streptomyces rochei]